MTPKQTLNKIKQLAKISKKLNTLKEKLSETEFFEDLLLWDIGGVFSNCEIKNGELYTSDGDYLSGDGRCMDEQIPYFVNQSTGYSGDDFYGTMYIKVDDNNTFVAVTYGC